MMSSAANQTPLHLSVVAVSCQQVAGISAHSPQDMIFLFLHCCFIEELSAGFMKEDSVVRLIRVMLSGWAAAFSHPVLGAGWRNELMAVQRGKLDGACRLAVGQITRFWLLQFVNAGPSLVIRCSIRSEKKLLSDTLSVCDPD
jgi:hypothetical protein